MQILTWYDSGRKFGLPIQECMEIASDVRLTIVPHARPFVSGIVNLRGDTVTVLNLSKLLSYTENQNTEKKITIRLKVPGLQIAIQAERVYDILEIPEDTLEDAEYRLGEEAQFIEKVAITSDGLILILSSKALQKLNV